MDTIIMVTLSDKIILKCSSEGPEEYVCGSHGQDWSRCYQLSATRQTTYREYLISVASSIHYKYINVSFKSMVSMEDITSTMTSLLTQGLTPPYYISPVARDRSSGETWEVTQKKDKSCRQMRLLGGNPHILNQSPSCLYCIKQSWEDNCNWTLLGTFGTALIEYRHMTQSPARISNI